MFRVSYKLYGKIAKEKTFDSERDAKGFFYGYCVKATNVSSAKLEALEND